MDTGGFNREAIVPRLDRLLDKLAARRQVQHAIVGAAALDGSWSWTGATGQSGPDGAPMRPETPWFLASVTKLYIAAVVLRLCERGLIDLGTSITAYLPADLINRLHVYNGVDYTDQISATHLLGHLSGLPDYLDERPDGKRSLMEEILEAGDQTWTSREAVVRARDLLTPHFAPSEPAERRPKIRYSDTNYQLLMLIAEHATGRTMPQLYSELLLEPLKLKHTWLPGHQPVDPAGQPATIYLGDLPLHRPLALQSFGDLYSTIDDVLSFGRALFSGNAFDHPETVEVMGRRFARFGFPRGMASLRAPSWPIEYGLGIMRFKLSRWLSSGMRIPTLLGHTGSTGSWLWYLPDLSMLVAGTVDQTAAAAVPFRQVPRALAGLRPSAP